jgi:hypothetical protein
MILTHLFVQQAELAQLQAGGGIGEALAEL